MKKEVMVLISSFIIVLFIKFTSAFYNYYGFPFSNFLYSIGGIQTLLFAAIFIILFWPVYYSLSKIFKDHYGNPYKGANSIMAAAISILMVYGIYMSNFNIESFFVEVGIPSLSLQPFMIVLILIALILMIWFIGFYALLIVSGIFIIALSIFTDIIYEKKAALITGVFLIGIGLLMWKQVRKRYSWEKEVKQLKSGFLPTILGALIILYGWGTNNETILIIGVSLTLINLIVMFIHERKKKRRNYQIRGI